MKHGYLISGDVVCIVGLGHVSVGWRQMGSELCGCLEQRRGATLIHRIITIGKDYYDHVI